MEGIWTRVYNWSAIGSIFLKSKTSATHGVWDKIKLYNLPKRPFVSCRSQSAFRYLSSPSRSFRVSYGHTELLATWLCLSQLWSWAHGVSPAWNGLLHCPNELLLIHEGPIQMSHSLRNLPKTNLPLLPPFSRQKGAPTSIVIPILYTHFFSHMTVSHSMKRHRHPLPSYS